MMKIFSKKNLLLHLIVGFSIGLMQAQVTQPPVESDFETIMIKPQQIVKLGEGHYFFDFGKAYFGNVVLESQVTQNDSLIVYLGEKLAAKTKIDRNPGGTIRFQRVKLSKLNASEKVELNLPIDKRHKKPAAVKLPESFGVITPFRYVEIENLQFPIEELKIWQKAIHYNFDDEAAIFKSSDTVLNAIWDLGKHSIKATSFSGYYVDGDRERIPYEADAYINQLSHYALDNEYSLARRTNEYFIENPTWPTEWLLHTVMLFYQDYMYTGNIDLLETYYEDLKLKTLMDLEREDGLISSKSDKLTGELKLELGFDNPKTNVRDIVDWPAGQKDTGWKLATKAGERDGYDMVEINTVVNSFYYYNMYLMSEIAGYLGKSDDAKFFAQKAKKVKNTINQKLLDTSKGYYVDGEGSTHSAVHANMLPLAFNIVPDAYKESVAAYVKTRGMGCSVYGAQYLLEGLLNVNESQYALDLITETESDRSWYNMIKIGSTIALEAWDMKYKPNSDWNHAWGTAPTNIITRNLWGVTPKTPGFAIAQIKPQLNELENTEIRVPTKLGSIDAKYYTNKEGFKVFEIALPVKMKGEFVVPTNTVEVIHNNVNLGNTKIVQLKDVENTIILK